jgi:hypothetical protein
MKSRGSLALLKFFNLFIHIFFEKKKALNSKSRARKKGLGGGRKVEAI